MKPNLRTLNNPRGHEPPKLDITGNRSPSREMWYWPLHGHCHYLCMYACAHAYCNDPRTDLFLYDWLDGQPTIC